MPKPEAPKAGATAAPVVTQAPAPAGDLDLARVQAANPNARVYRSSFGCIVTEHGKGKAK
jgi:hypothetical protein